MKALTWIVILLLALLSAFALLNWSAFTAPMALSVGLATVHVPLGLIMLAALGLLTAAFLAFIAYQQASALAAARRAARDLHAHRDLADKAEASRFTELRNYLEIELRHLDERTAAACAATDARLDRLQAEILARFSDIAGGLSAHVAEVEDKIDRASQREPPRTTASWP